VRPLGLRLWTLVHATGRGGVDACHLRIMVVGGATPRGVSTSWIPETGRPALE
jgi:hypothetical protein